MLFIIVGSLTAAAGIVICSVVVETKSFPEESEAQSAGEPGASGSGVSASTGSAETGAVNQTPADVVAPPVPKAGPALPAVTWRLFLSKFLIALNFSVMNACAAFVFFDNFGEGPQTVGLSVMGAGIMMAALQFFVVPRVLRMEGMQTSKVLTFAILGMTLFLCVWPFMPLLGLMLLFFYLYMVGFTFIMPGIPDIIATVTPPPIMGKAMGLNMACFSLGRTVGPLIGGALYDTPVRWTAFAWGSLCSLGAAALMANVWCSGADKPKPGSSWPGVQGAVQAKEIELTVTDDAVASPNGAKEAEKHIEL